MSREDRFARLNALMKKGSVVAALQGGGGLSPASPMTQEDQEFARRTGQVVQLDSRGRLLGAAQSSRNIRRQFRANDGAREASGAAARAQVAGVRRATVQGFDNMRILHSRKAAEAQQLGFAAPLSRSVGAPRKTNDPMYRPTARKTAVVQQQEAGWGRRSSGVKPFHPQYRNPVSVSPAHARPFSRSASVKAHGGGLATFQGALRSKSAPRGQAARAPAAMSSRTSPSAAAYSPTNLSGVDSEGLDSRSPGSAGRSHSRPSSPGASWTVAFDNLSSVLVGKITHLSGTTSAAAFLPLATLVVPPRRLTRTPRLVFPRPCRPNRQA
jgi:hypothetical protein